MPQGKPLSVPDDGLTTAQRRHLPLLMVHTGDGKGKSTAAFGTALRAWNQGWDVGVFQFVKSATWRIGEQTVLERLGELHEQTGEGGPVSWHKMGAGWSWRRKAGDETDHAADAAEQTAQTPGRPTARPVRGFACQFGCKLGLKVSEARRRGRVRVAAAIVHIDIDVAPRAPVAIASLPGQPLATTPRGHRWRASLPPPCPFL